MEPSKWFSLKAAKSSFYLPKSGSVVTGSLPKGIPHSASSKSSVTCHSLTNVLKMLLVPLKPISALSLSCILTPSKLLSDLKTIGIKEGKISLAAI